MFKNDKNELRAILYARVSTHRQIEKDLSIPAQFEQMRKYCSEMGWEIIDEISDEGSGKRLNRAGLQGILELASCKPKPFDILLVWKFSRLARDLRNAVNLEHELKQKDIEIISVSEPIDNDTVLGQSFRGMLHIVNQMYSLQLSEDIKKGMVENAQRGYWNGNLVPFGYRVLDTFDEKGNRKKKLAFDPETAPIVKRIFQMYLSGMGYRKIADMLNQEGQKNHGKNFSLFVTSRILKDERYIGVQKWDKVRIENNHPVIIDPETFKKTQQVLKQRAKLHPKRVYSQYLLSGLVFCGNCGYGMLGLTTKGSSNKYYCYYMCANRSIRGKSICSAPLIPQKKLEAFILENIQKQLTNPAEVHKIYQQLLSPTDQQIDETTLTQKKEQLQDIESRLQKIYDALETGQLPVELIASRLKDLTNQKKSLELEIADLEIQAISPSDIPFSFAEIEKELRNLPILFDIGTMEEKRIFLRSIISKIIVTDDDIHIEYSREMF